jgi:hypothetical protein
MLKAEAAKLAQTQIKNPKQENVKKMAGLRADYIGLQENIKANKVTRRIFKTNEVSTRLSKSDIKAA